MPSSTIDQLLKSPYGTVTKSTILDPAQIPDVHPRRYLRVPTPIYLCEYDFGADDVEGGYGAAAVGQVARETRY
jgi:hypothetical protein